MTMVKAIEAKLAACERSIEFWYTFLVFGKHTSDPAMK
jgi:hypothetical protein